MYVALAAGKVDAIVFDRPVLENAALVNHGFRVLDHSLGKGVISVGAPHGKEALIGKVNAFIRRVRADGTYVAMYERWGRTIKPEMPRIPDPERPDGVLSVGVCLTEPPMSFLGKDGPSGYDIEFARRLARDLNLKVEFHSLEYDALLAAISTGKYDLGVAQFDATPEHCKSMLMSDGYIDNEVGVMVWRGTSSGRTFAQALKDGLSSTFVDEARWKLVAEGLLTTAEIAIFAVLLGTLLAFPLWLALISRSRIVSSAGRLWVEVLQGTPVLVMLLIVFYVAFAKVDVSPVLVAVLVFGCNFSAYAGEALKAG